MSQLDFSHVGTIVVIAIVAIGLVAAAISLIAAAGDGYGPVRDRTRP